MDTIFIEGLEINTIIGVYPHERTNKQNIILDIEMQYDARQACASDNLKYGLDYHKATIDIHDYVSQSSYHLIESLADAIAQRILRNKIIKQVKLTLSKPKALEQAKNVGIKILRSN